MGKGLGYSLGEDLAMVGYSDASYGSDLESMRGRSGYVFSSAGQTISSGSKLLDVVWLSCTEAKYMAISHIAASTGTDLQTGPMRRPGYKNLLHIFPSLLCCFGMCHTQNIPNL